MKMRKTEEGGDGIPIFSAGVFCFSTISHHLY